MRPNLNVDRGLRDPTHESRKNPRGNAMLAPTKVQVKPGQLFIGGRFTSAISGKTFDSINPATGAVLTKVAEADAADVDAAVKAARAAFESGPWPKMSAAERGRILWRAADIIL